MFQKDISLTQKMNVNDGFVVVNQTDFSKYPPLHFSNENKLFISNEERGLSRSRNTALQQATADVCIIADDDLVYQKGFLSTIEKAYQRYPDADVILFDYYLGNGARVFPLAHKEGRINKWQSLRANSVRTTFKRNVILEHGIKYNERFGSGSGEFVASEDNIFLLDCFRAKRKVYYVPLPILRLNPSESTWFKGYDATYFRSFGAFSYHFMKRWWWIYAFQFLIRHPKITKQFGFFNAFRAMSEGRKQLLNP